MTQNFEAFRFADDIVEGRIFTESFLNSYDFDLQALRSICRTLNLPVSGKTKDLAFRISGCDDPSVNRAVIEHLVLRTKTAFAFKAIAAHNFPIALNPETLVTHIGEQEWYGPITRPDDPNGAWYIHPLYFEYFERDQDRPNEEPEKFIIRWLCLARIGEGIVSLHWHGFTYQNQDTLNPRSRAQFPYWRHIERLFDKLEDLLGAPLVNVKLRDLVLEAVLDEYRRNPEYYWSERRLRAEGGGVSLNVRAGSQNKDDEFEDSEQEADDIKYLAFVIRRAIEHKLITDYQYKLPDPAEIDETIIITLIKKYGTQSYEMVIRSKTGEKLFNAHCYFGAKPTSNTPDAFGHFQLKDTVALSNLRQLKFLLTHLIRDSHLETQ